MSRGRNRKVTAIGGEESRKRLLPNGREFPMITRAIKVVVFTKKRNNISPQEKMNKN